MSDMDPLYESMKSSAEDMSKAAVEQKRMMTANDQTDVNIEGYGPTPSYAKQLRELTGKNLFYIAPDEPTGIEKTENGQYFMVPQGTDGAIAFNFYLNDNGTAVLVASELNAGVFLAFLSLFNSMFNTFAAPGYDLVVRNIRGEYAGGLKETGEFEFGALISNLLNAVNIVSTQVVTDSLTAGGIQFTADVPAGYDVALMNSLQQFAVALKNDGTFEIGKAHIYNAQIDQMVSDLMFKGGASTTGDLPEGFVQGIVDNLARMVFGIDQYGNIHGGTIIARKLIADFIESPSISVQKKPLAVKLPDLIHLIIYGQSLSTGVNAQPLQTIAEIVNAWRFVAGVRAQDGTGTSAENHASIVAYKETSAVTGDGTGYETPMGGVITAIMDRLEAEAEGYEDGMMQFLGSAPGQGGRSISALKQPTGTYMTRFKDDMTYGLARANEKGWTYAPHAAIWLQGEADQSAGTPAATYMASFGEMVDTVNSLASTLLGSPVFIPWFIYQLNSWRNRTPNNTYPTIPLALLQLARTRDDTRLVQPMYMYDYFDNAHLLGFDSKMCGYRFGIAIEQEMLSGKKFEPLWSKDVALQNGIANIWYNPVGKLVLDTSLVSDPGNYGISAVDPSGNPLTITEVSVHLDRLRVRASSGIPSGSKIRLGFIGGTPGTLPSRTNGPRCCLRDSQGDTIKFDPTGVAYRMDNYAIVEEITV